MRRSIFAVTACAALVVFAQNSYAGFMSNLEDSATGSNGAAIGGLAGGKKGALIGAGAGAVTEGLRHHYQNQNANQQKQETGLHASIDQLTKAKAAADSALTKAQSALDAAIAQKNNLSSEADKAKQDQVIAKIQRKVTQQKKKVATAEQKLEAAQGQNN